MNEILYIHDLFEIYPEYIPEMHWCCMRLGCQRNPPINLLIGVAVAKAQERVKEANREIGTKIAIPVNINWIESLYHVLNHTKEIRTKYYYLQQQKELPF